MSAKLMEMRGMVLGVLVGLLVLAGPVVLAGYLNQTFSGVRIGDDQNLGDGVTLQVLDAVDLSFVNDTSDTASVDVGSSYYVSGAWKSSSADPGKWTLAVSGGTLTGTCATATTGTLSVILIEVP